MTQVTRLQAVALPDPSPAERAQMLMQEATEAATEHMETVLRHMSALISDADQVKGAAYPPGWIEECRRMSSDLDARGQRLLAMLERRS